MTNAELLEKYEKRLKVSEAVYKRDGALSHSMSADAKYDDETKITIAEALESVNKYVPKPSVDSKYKSEISELRRFLFNIITVLSGEFMQIGEYNIPRPFSAPVSYGISTTPPSLRINTKELMQEVFEETIDTLLNNIKETYRYEGIDIETGNEYEHWDDI